MGGRGQTSRTGGMSADTAAKAANRYRITSGTRYDQLVKLGATQEDIASIYGRYRANLMSGMGRRDSMVAAERDFRQNAIPENGKSPDGKRSSGGRPSGMSKTSYDRYKAQGFSDAQIAKIWDDTKRARKRMASSPSRARSEEQVTTTTYERAQRRLQKDVDKWFGRGSG